VTNKYYKEDAWWVSLYNEKPEVQDASVPKQPVEVHDATLRDGEQTPGVVFSVDDKLRIAEKLIETGVTRIEAGMPAVSKPDYDAIKAISSTFKEANVYAFVRAMRSDIDMACECGVKGVVIEVPIGYPKLKYQFGWTWENVLEKSMDCINHARSLGLKAVYFPYDTTRARESDLENLVSGIMQHSPPDAIGIVDTMGCALPRTIEFLVKKMKKLTNGLSVEVHTHNDFGLAVATELAGIAAGADVVHACVNGLGERTGNAALEELIMAMNILLGMDTPYKLDKLGELCDLVEKISGVPVAPNKPFSGTRNYTRESGIGVNLVVDQPLAMFATDPRYFGKTGEIVLGKKSGKASVQYYLDKLGITATDEQVTEVLERVKALGVEKKRLVTAEEFQGIIEECI
jgi:isopropylmalate/homocitrate/citramalate synthase